VTARPAARVLVVDDSEVIRELIAINLELEGFEVFTAIDGQDALDRVAAIQPHVMTIDVRMPRLDGISLVQTLRREPSTAHIRVVMVTASAQEAEVRRGEAAGVDAYLTKPFEPDVLVGIVRDLAAGRSDPAPADNLGR
jgi:CheY-like chemotaxis protein